MNYAIAAGHELTASTARDILQAGGNAVDAAIASYFVSFIAEPCMASAGGGGFAMVHMASHEPQVFDFFCQTPGWKRSADQSDFRPIEVDFGTTTEEFHIGLGSAAVPGVVAGLYQLHAHHGSMPMRDLVQPAIKAAKEGVVINAFQHLDFRLLQEIFRQSERGRTLLFDEDDTLRPIGERIYMPQLADLLDALSIEGEALFYRGEIAAAISRDSEAGGGHLRRSDFEAYQVNVGKGISLTIGDHQLVTMPPPSFGGAIIAYLLHKLKDKFEAVDFLSERHFQLLHAAFAESQHLQKEPNALIDQLNRMAGLRVSGFPGHGRKWGGTTHFNIMDRAGNAVSLSSTIGEGSGYFIPGTDMQLNNMLGESALLPNGLHSWDTNVRLMSMMAPTLILGTSGALEVCLGTGGAGRIPYAIAQVLVNLLFFDRSLMHAIGRPRVHHMNGVTHVEPGFRLSPDLDLGGHDLLKWDARSLFFGGVHALRVRGGEVEAVGDARRHGVALLA